jgi:hypothetical protein
MMRHFGMTPRTTEIGAREQNGDVEAGNGALKRRLRRATVRSSAAPMGRCLWHVGCRLPIA